MKLTQKQLAGLILKDRALRQSIEALSKDTEETALWAYATQGDVSIIKIEHRPLYDLPTVAGLNFGQKCLTGDQIFKKLLDLIEQ